MIVLDTSVLVDGLTGERRSEREMRIALLEGEQILIPAIVAYEWRRGSRLPEELATQEALFPERSIIPFTYADALVSADIYRRVRHPRSREIDLAIAATAITRDAALWTLNISDFQDIPGLRLYHSA